MHKKGRKPTKKQKKLLDANGFNPADWLSVKKNNDEFVFVHRKDKRAVSLWKIDRKECS